jgi:hypothetical protein
MARAVAFVLLALPLGCTAILAEDDLTFRDSGSGGQNCPTTSFTAVVSGAPGPVGDVDVSITASIILMGPF